MQHIFRSLPEAFKDFEGSEAAQQAIVFAAWKIIAGETLARHAVPVRLNKKKLVIAVSSDVWLKQIKDLSAQMIFKLNTSLGASFVNFIQFCIDAKAVDIERNKAVLSKIEEAELKAAALREITPELRRAAETIADEKLRYNFLLAAGGCLARNSE